MAPIRAKTACQKCRSLKHRCDFKYPRCSRCERAKIDCLVRDMTTKEIRLRETFDPKFNESTATETQKTQTAVFDLSQQQQWPQNEQSGTTDQVVWNSNLNPSSNSHQLPAISPSDSRFGQRIAFNNTYGGQSLNNVPLQQQQQQQQQQQDQQQQQHPLGVLSSAALPMGYPANGQIPAAPIPAYGVSYQQQLNPMHPQVPHQQQQYPFHLPHMYPPPPTNGYPVPGMPPPENASSSNKPLKFGLSTSQITALSFIPFKSSFLGPNNSRTSVNDISMFGGNQFSGRSTPVILGTNLEQSPLVNLPAKSLTKEVILENYFNHAWIQYPVISFDKESLEAKIDYIYDLIDHIELDSKYREADVVSHLMKAIETQINPLDMFTIYILLAVGLGITADATIGGLIKKGLAVESPKKYFKTATFFLEKFFTSIPELVNLNSNNKMKCFGIQFKSLQSLLLMSVFGLLEPISPGIWYIISVAMRLAVDMDLHQESVLHQLELDSLNSSSAKASSIPKTITEYDFLKEFNPTSRYVFRQVFWSCYALERQISFYVNKPFNISDFDITSNIDIYLSSHNNPLFFPGFYVRGRKIQSIIQQIMILPASSDVNNTHPLLLLSGSLANFTVKAHTDLNKWIFDFIKLEISSNQDVLTKFQNIKDFVFLNYFQLIQHLYKPSPRRSQPLQDDLEILAMASSRIILIYERLHKARKINFKYLSVHFIHQSSMSFMYSLVNSKLLSLDPHTLEATKLLMDKSFELIDYLKECCPPAANVGNTLSHMYRATTDLITKRQRESDGKVRSSVVITDLHAYLGRVSKPDESQENGVESNNALDFGFDLNDNEYYLMKKYTCVPLKLNHLKRISSDTNSKKPDDAGNLNAVDIAPSTSINSVTGSGIQGNDVDIDDFLKSIITYEDLGVDFNALTKKQDSSASPLPAASASPQLNTPETNNKMSPFPGYNQRLHGHLLEPSYQSGIHSVSNLRQSSPDNIPPLNSNTPNSVNSPGGMTFKVEGNEVSQQQQSNGEFTDIQQIWEMLFDQPFNIKETMMNGGFSKVI